MKKLYSVLLALLPFAVWAQEETQVQPRFGTIAYTQVLESMPQWAQAQATVDSLSTIYNKEMERGESEFQRKFADFLQGQKDFPVNIMQKRQKELQDLMEQGIAFRQEVQKLLQQAREEIISPVRRQLDETIKAVGAERKLTFVFNTDGGALPFVTADGEVIDITPIVQEELK